MRVGVGSCKWADNSSYQGDWAQGKRHGNGIFITAEGHKYEGAFINDVKHGEGRLSYKNGEIVEGCWENDRLNGVAHVTKDGSTSTVIFVNDMRIDDASGGNSGWDTCYAIASVFMLAAVITGPILANSHYYAPKEFYGLLVFYFIYQLMSARNRASIYLENMETIKDFAKTISKTIAAEPIVSMGI
jgi:hypothetical protein